MQTVIDGNLINYEIFGAKQKNNILILHGWKNSLKNWENVGKKLSEKNKVVLVDLPGMGNSSIPKIQPFGTYDYAKLINKFIEKLDLKEVTLIGHSFGGKTGIVSASTNTRIKKLVLVDNSGINTKSLTTRLKTNLYKMIRLFLPKKIAAKFSNILSSEDYRNAGDLLASFKKIVREDVSEDAKKIKVPTLIVWGENDKEVPLTSAKKLKSLISSSTLRIVWRTGHHLHLEKPEKFLEIIYEFI